MGWKGAVRSIRASMREAEREAARRQRQLEKEHREYSKMMEIAVAHEVALHENHIERLISLHKDSSRRLNWVEICFRS